MRTLQSKGLNPDGLSANAKEPVSPITAYYGRH